MTRPGSRCIGRKKWRGHNDQRHVLMIRTTSTWSAKAVHHLRRETAARLPGPTGLLPT